VNRIPCSNRRTEQNDLMNHDSKSHVSSMSAVIRVDRESDSNEVDDLSTDVSDDYANAPDSI
jgi:hypothetical protein